MSIIHHDTTVGIPSLLFDGINQSIDKKSVVEEGNYKLQHNAPQNNTKIRYSDVPYLKRMTN